MKPFTEADRLVLAKRIGAHKAPPIMLPVVDRKLLAKTAKRLRKSRDVVRDEPCSPMKN